MIVASPLFELASIEPLQSNPDALAADSFDVAGDLEFLKDLASRETSINDEASTQRLPSLT